MQVKPSIGENALNENCIDAGFNLYLMFVTDLKLMNIFQLVSDIPTCKSQGCQAGYRPNGSVVRTLGLCSYDPDSRRSSEKKFMQ